MPRSYSIAEARQDLAALLHRLERQPHIELTRRGVPVAVLLSMQEYQRLSAPKRGFWEAYQGFARDADLPGLGIEPEVFEGVREPGPGREVRW
jgi:prevent-host-death family protein